jgi:probable rRNA maturation factor
LLSSHYYFARANIMMKLKLSIQIERPFTGLVSRKRLKEAVALALSHAGINKAVELGLVIASDETVHSLNRKYRGVDRTTDVLAFAFAEVSANKARPFAVPPDNISYPQAKRQAEQQRHSLEKEFALLVAHGVLHLLGYDHEQPEEAKSMRALETKVLQELKGKG